MDDTLPNIYNIATIFVVFIIVFSFELLNNTFNRSGATDFGVSDKILAIMKFDMVMKLTRDEYARKTRGKATPESRSKKNLSEFDSLFD